MNRLVVPGQARRSMTMASHIQWPKKTLVLKIYNTRNRNGVRLKQAAFSNKVKKSIWICYSYRKIFQFWDVEVVS